MKNSYITGVGCATSLGCGIENVWSLMKKNQSKQSIREYHLDEFKSFNYRVHPVEKNELRTWIDRKTQVYLEKNGLKNDIDSMLLFASINTALMDAKLQLKGKKVALILAHENPGVVKLLDTLFSEVLPKSTTEDAMKLFQEYQKTFFNIQTFPHLFHSAKIYGIDGPTYTVNNACASGLYAIHLGDRLIQQNDADIVIVASSDYAHITEHLWLQQKGFISDNGTIRPFDVQRDGSVLGDGGGALILESNHSTQSRNIEPYCKYIGGSFYQDHWKMTLPDITGENYKKCIMNALKQTNYDIDLLVPHGTGSPIWDKFEALEINKAFKQCYGDAKVTSFKGYIGHTLGASSLIESILLIKCLKENTVLPVKNLEQTDDDIKLPLVTDTVKKNIQIGMKTVSAYGGFNAVALFSKL